MKKIISVIIVAVLLLSFSLGVSALDVNELTLTVSDDLKTVYIDGATYSLIDASKLWVDEYDENEDAVEYAINVQLSETQKESIKSIEADVYDEKILISASISAKDGMEIFSYYLREDYLDDYAKLLNGEYDEVSVDFEYPEDNTVEVDKEKLFGNGSTIEIGQMDYYDWFYVYAENGDKKLSLRTGWIFSIERQYYFADFEELGDAAQNGYFDPSSISNLTVYEIEDEELVNSLRQAESEYNSDLTFAFDDGISKIISGVFMVFTFGVIPLIILITSLIFVFRTKKLYRKIFVAVCGLSAAEIAIFSVLVAVILNAQ